MDKKRENQLFRYIFAVQEEIELLSSLVAELTDKLKVENTNLSKKFYLDPCTHQEHDLWTITHEFGCLYPFAERKSRTIVELDVAEVSFTFNREELLERLAKLKSVLKTIWNKESGS